MTTNQYATDFFKYDELRCRGCDGSCSWSRNGKPLFNVDERALSMLSEFRKLIGKPFTPNSCTRCPIHNARVGGAPKSQHRATFDKPSLAFDVPLVGIVPKKQIVEAAEEVGFMGIGANYKTFVHMDARSWRARW